MHQHIKTQKYNSSLEVSKCDSWKRKFIPVGRKIAGSPDIFVKTNELLLPCFKFSVLLNGKNQEKVLSF